VDEVFDTYINELFAELGITRLVDVLEDPATITRADRAFLAPYADMARRTWLGCPLVLQDGRDGGQVMAGLLRARLIEALVVGPEDPSWIRHLEWMWSVCANESLARRFLALMPTVLGNATLVARREVAEAGATGLRTLAKTGDIVLAL
jgi:hypothetical protein